MNWGGRTSKAAFVLLARSSRPFAADGRRTLTNRGSRAQATQSAAPAELLHTYTFHKRLARTPGPSLVLFFSPFCGSCHTFRRLLPDVQERGTMAAFEVDAGDSLGLVNEHEVMDLPALFLYNDGEFHASIQAPPVVQELEAAVLQALDLPPEEAP